jgi:hypothetical protein
LDGKVGLANGVIVAQQKRSAMSELLWSHSTATDNADHEAKDEPKFAPHAPPAGCELHPKGQSRSPC